MPVRGGHRGQSVAGTAGRDKLVAIVRTVVVRQGVVVMAIWTVVVHQ